VPTDADGNVLAFLEKPERKEDIVTDQINAGMYVFKRKVIDSIATGRVVSVEREVFPNLLKAGMKVIGVVDEGYWLDLGTPNAFVKGSSDLVMGKIKTGLLNTFADKLILSGAQIDNSAKVINGSVIGINSIVGKDCEIDHSVISNDVFVAEKCVIESSIIAKGAKIGAGCVVKNSVVADAVELAAGSVLINDSRIWPDQKVAKIELNNQTIPTNPDWGI
jgi:mannose-1-phosphate guanylyltransferase